MDETGAYYTEWSKPERKTPVQYTNTYMEFRKMEMIILYVRQQKRHRCIEQCFGCCGRRRGWDDLREKHWNMYIIICVTVHQSGFDVWGRVLRAVHWDDPERRDGKGGGREGQNGEHMYTHGGFMWMYGKKHHNIVK